MEKRRGGSLKGLGLSHQTLANIYSDADLDEDERLALFGRDLDFLGHAQSANPERARPTSRYHSLGRYRHRSMANSETPRYHSVLGEVRTVPYVPRKRVSKLPEEVRSMIDPEEVGSYVDELGREYIPMANDEQWSELGWYNVRMPLALYRDKEERAEVGFPDCGSMVTLRGRGRILRCLVDDGPAEVSKSVSTALIKLTVKTSEADIG